MESKKAPVGTEAHGAYAGGAHVVYHTIETTDDRWYQIKCSICLHGAILGSVVVSIDAPSHGARNLFICGTCLEKMAEYAPPDMRHHKVKERMEKIVVESPLVGWIQEAK